MEFRCYVAGFRAKSKDWPKCLFEYRDFFNKERGHYPQFIFPAIDSSGNPTFSKASKEAATVSLHKFIEMAGVPPGTAPYEYTLHSPRNFYTNAASQMGWGEEAMTVLGRWSPGSSMPSRYVRSNGTQELNLRRDVINRIRGGWEPAREGESTRPPIPLDSNAARHDPPVDDPVHELD